MGGFVCDADSGACERVEVIGHGAGDPTADYYQYAYFTTVDSPFLGGADVDAFEDMIYVNRDGSHVDVYSVEVLDSDGDGTPEPNQHPDNPREAGPIEERVLTLVMTYDVPIGSTHNNELYVTGVTIAFTRSTSAPGDVSSTT